VEAGMRWDDTYKSNHECYQWHDLLDDDEEQLLGYVRENTTNGEFIAMINAGGMPNEKFDNLEDAKAHIVTYYVTQKLEGT
jgi:hypothetical protein